MSDVREQRVRRAGSLAAVAVALTALLLPATSLGAAGSLDRSFSGNGRVAVKTAKETARGNIEVSRLQPIPMASAPAPHGELVAANSRRVLRFRANGRPWKYFGGNGRVAIPTPAGMSFQLAGVATDSRGRLLVAGTTEPATGVGSGSLDARVSVYRFMPNGKLDGSFGEGAVAGGSLGPLEATGLAVDSHDRPVLTGFAALTPSVCNTTPVYLNTTTVARLTTKGAPDPSFGGGDGVFSDSLEDPQLPVLAGGGKIAYISSPESRCAGFVGFDAGDHPPEASFLSPGGNLLRRFPVSGPGSFEFLEVTSLAVDRKNRVVVLMTRANAEGGNFHQQVRRLLPDGSPDPSFGVDYGEAGVVSSPGPAGSRLHALTTDGRNRVLLAGSTSLGRNGRAFVAVRLNAAGKLQTGFGHDGAAKAGFGKRAEATASQIHLDSRGRIVLGGTVEAPWLSTGYGLAFARVLSGG